jgi:tetratricopeptide (TPR) repeat protein
MMGKDSASEKISALNRQATKLKKDDPPAAVACLREAQALRAKTSTSFPTETWLRLPLLLQQMGRFVEAMAEFEQILRDEPRHITRECAQSSAATQASAQAAAFRAIYEKMALACKREKRMEDHARYQALAEEQRARHLEYRERVEQEHQEESERLARKAQARKQRLQSRR